jgi:signal transduction histidine kinase
MVVAAIDFGGAVQEATNPVQGDPALKLPAVPGWAYVLVVAAGLALAGRRRWPVATLAVVGALTVAYSALGYNDGAPLLAVAVALFELPVRATARTTFLALAVTVAAMVLAQGVFSPFGWASGPITVTPFVLSAGAGLGFAAANRRSHLVRMQERAEEAERDREEEARRRVDAERLRIARELHDVVAHSMATVNVQAGVAVHLLRERPDDLAQAVEAMESVRATSKEALREMRGILNLLRSSDDVEPVAPVPRLSQLDDLVAAVVKAGLPTTVRVTGPVRPLPAAVDLAAYRVVQESLTNTLRHAGPARAEVKLAYGPDGLEVVVSDDGRGAAAGAQGAVAGNGLRGMAERARAAGGTASAGPAPAGGFAVRAFLPCPGPGDGASELLAAPLPTPEPTVSAP